MRSTSKKFWKFKWQQNPKNNTLVRVLQKVIHANLVPSLARECQQYLEVIAELKGQENIQNVTEIKEENQRLQKALKSALKRTEKAELAGESKSVQIAVLTSENYRLSQALILAQSQIDCLTTKVQQLENDEIPSLKAQLALLNARMERMEKKEKQNSEESSISEEGSSITRAIKRLTY